MILSQNLSLSTLQLANFAAGGFIGAASATINGCSKFSINQTTQNINLSIPSPSENNSGMICIIENIGTASFRMHNTVINPQSSKVFTWNGTTWLSDRKIQPFAVAPILAIAGITTTSSLNGVYRRSTDKTITYSWFINATIPVGLGGWKTFTAPTIANFSTGSVKCSTYRTTNFTGFPPAPFMGNEVHQNYSSGATNYIMTTTAPTALQIIYLTIEITYTAI